MTKHERIVSYTREEAEELLRSEDLTDYARLDAMTEEELEASIDIAEEGEPIWSEAITGLPQPSPFVKVGIDLDIVRWFESQGQDYQDRINAALRDYVATQERQPAGSVRQ